MLGKYLYNINSHERGNKNDDDDTMMTTYDNIHEVKVGTVRWAHSYVLAAICTCFCIIFELKLKLGRQSKKQKRNEKCKNDPSSKHNFSGKHCRKFYPEFQDGKLGLLQTFPMMSK